MTLQTHILPKNQLALYPYLKAITELGFVLFGGTAIALQLGHRHSIDFDFFTHIDITNLHDILLNLDNITVKTTFQKTDNALVFKTNNEVKFSFFGTLDFVKLANIVQSDDEILKLANLEALLIAKLKATCDRAEYKDYKDIIAILKTGQVSLENGLLGVLDYFGDKFPLINIIKGLNYFEDGDLYELSKDDKIYLCEKVNSLDMAQLNKEVALKKQYLQSPFKDNNIKKETNKALFRKK